MKRDLLLLPVFRLLCPIVFPLLLGAGPATTTRPTSAPTPGFWLEHALREAAAIEDAVLRAEAYGKAAVLMARLGDLPAYRRTIALAEQSLGQATTKPKASPVQQAVDLATTPILRSLVLTGDLTGARELAEERSKASKYSRPGYYAIIAGAQVEAGDLEAALATANTLNEYERGGALAQIVSALVVRKNFAAAEEVAGMMGPKDLKGRDAIRKIAAARAGAGEYEAALALAEQLPYALDKQDVYKSVVEAQAETGNYAAARITASQTPPTDKPQLPHYGRNLAYTSIAHIQLRRNDIAGAKETAALFDGELKPNLLRDIARAEIKSGDLAAAQKTASTIPPDAGPMDIANPRIDAHQTLAVAFARARNFKEAIDVAKSLPAPFETLLRVGEIAIIRHEPVIAKQILRELEDEAGGIRVFDWDVDPTGIRVARLQKALGNAGPYDAAVTDLKRRAADARDPDAQQTATAQLFGLYLSENDMDAARKLAPMLPKGGTTFAISLMATEVVRSGELDRAKALAELVPTPQDRAQLLELILKNAPGTEQTPDKMVDQIADLPTAYDRSIAYLAQATRAWSGQ